MREPKPSNGQTAGQAPADAGEVVPFPKLGSKENPYPHRNSDALRDVLVAFADRHSIQRALQRLIERAELGADRGRRPPGSPLTDRWLAMTRERIADPAIWYQSDRTGRVR